MQAPNPPVTLLSLPNELLLAIGKGLACPKDLYSLVWTNRRFARLLILRFHQHTVPDKELMTTVQWAASKGHTMSIKLLLENDTNIEFYCNTDYFGRVGFCTVTCRTADFSTVDMIGIGRRTALNHAVEFGDEEMVRLLLKAGASVDMQDDYGETALHRAAKGESKAVMQLLLSMGPDISLRDRHGNTALHHSASFSFKRRRLEMMRLLLESGAEVNTSNNRGETALHMAAKRGKETLVELLKQYGASS